MRTKKYEELLMAIYLSTYVNRDDEVMSKLVKELSFHYFHYFEF